MGGRATASFPNADANARPKQVPKFPAAPQTAVIALQNTIEIEIILTRFDLSASRAIGILKIA